MEKYRILYDGLRFKIQRLIFYRPWYAPWIKREGWEDLERRYLFTHGSRLVHYATLEEAHKKYPSGKRQRG